MAVLYLFLILRKRKWLGRPLSGQEYLLQKPDLNVKHPYKKQAGLRIPSTADTRERKLTGLRWPPGYLQVSHPLYPRLPLIGTTKQIGLPAICEDRNYMLNDKLLRFG